MMNRVAGALIVVFSLLYGLEAYGLESGFGAGVITPRSFPLLVAAIMGLIGVGIFFSPKPESATSDATSADLEADSAETNGVAADAERVFPTVSGWLNAGSLLASFVAYAFLLVPIGFITATALETAFVSQRFGAKIWQALITGITVSLALYALFVFALSIPLPVGRIFGGR